VTQLSISIYFDTFTHISKIW